MLAFVELPGLANSGNALYSGVGQTSAEDTVPRQSSSPLLIDGYLSNNPAGKANDSAPKVAADTGGTTGQRVLDGVQMALDLVGLIPGAGEVADGLNALISLARGNYVDAALSALSMVPFAGWAASAGKGARYTAKAIDAAGTAAEYSDELVDAGRYAAKYVNEAAGAVQHADEAVDAVQYAEDAANGARHVSNALTEAAGDVGKIPWDSWQNYEKVTANGQEYAKVGDRLYSRHAVDRMQPSGKKYTVGDAIVQAGGVSGRSVAPQFVEDVISSAKPVFQPVTGNYVYSSGTVKIVTNEYGHVVTIMTVG